MVQVTAIIGVKSVSAPVSSGIPQGTVLFSFAVELSMYIESEIRLFPTSVSALNREIKVKDDTVKHKNDIDRLGCWARRWGMRFQPL